MSEATKGGINSNIKVIIVRSCSAIYCSLRAIYRVYESFAFKKRFVRQTRAIGRLSYRKFKDEQLAIVNSVQLIVEIINTEVEVHY